VTVARPEVPDWVRSVIIIDREDIFGSVIEMGLAELAIRMGFPGGFDNRGDVIFADSFEEGGSKGWESLSGASAATGLSCNTSRFRGISLKLTAGSTLKRYASWRYYLPYPIPGKVGLQVSFTIEDNTQYFDAALLLYDGTNLHQAVIRYDHVNSKVQYLDSSNTYQDLVTGVELFGDIHAYHYLKMVVDMENDKYHRLLLDGWTWTDGDLAIYTVASALTKRFWGQVWHRSIAAAVAESYVDGVVITQNEPV